MDLFPYIVAYAAVGVFVIAVIARILMWKKMPMHVRWELYPVAHEGKRAEYGGSYLEETDWWKKPRESSMWGEVKVMVAEILFLKALRENNPSMWWRSYPFHLGIYLVSAATFVMIGASILEVISSGILAGGFGTLVMRVLQITAIGGLALGIVGAIGLLHRRLTHPDYQDFTAPADLFNLVFFVVAFGVSLAWVLTKDHEMAGVFAFVYSAVTFKTSFLGTMPALFTASVVLLGLLVAYIPMTHMSHFIGKYFAYHAIRWNDAPNTPGSDFEGPIKEVLNYPVSWSASHVGSDGKKSWAAVATEEVKK